MRMPAPDTLGIIAGKGLLPRLLIDGCIEQNRAFAVVGVSGFVEPETMHKAGKYAVELPIGQLGAALAFFNQCGVRDVVMAGHISRPKFSQVKPDAKGAKLLAKLTTRLFAGDDALLRTITDFLAAEGLRIVGADGVLESLVMPQGVLTTRTPSTADEADIARGIKVAKAIGRLDIGQGAIVQNSHVLGVEALEGTDALIERSASLRFSEGAGGVLVKMKKPGQEARVDLPSMGPKTITLLAQYGFAGVAMEAGNALLLEREATIAEANALGLFVVGVSG
jgi:DUF1009 family protein